MKFVEHMSKKVKMKNKIKSKRVDEAINLLERKRIIEKRIKYLESDLWNMSDNIHTSNLEHPLRHIYDGKRASAEIVENIVKKDELKKESTELKNLLSSIEEALSELPVQERKVIEIFYFTSSRYKADIACEELNYDRSQVYRIRANALNAFALAFFGE